MKKVNRREFVLSGTAASVAAVAGTRTSAQAPTVMTRSGAKPVVISSANGHRYKNGGSKTCVETAFAMMTEGKLVNAFVSSPFNASGRIEFLTQLMAHLDVHSYGKLFRNRKLDGDQGRPSKLDTIGKYKFTLAFENAIAEDYVTEKFYDPLLAGSVPVYLGAPNIDAFAPGDNCFINVADWSSAKALADYLLEVARDEVLYASFFAWKDEPFRAGFSRLLELTEERPFARLCKTIDERSRSAPPARWRWLERLRPSNRGTR